MDIEVFIFREKMLKLREKRLTVEEDRLAGHTGVTPDELANTWTVLSTRWSMGKETSA